MKRCSTTTTICSSFSFEYEINPLENMSDRRLYEFPHIESYLLCDVFAWWCRPFFLFGDLRRVEETATMSGRRRTKKWMDNNIRTLIIWALSKEYSIRWKTCKSHSHSPSSNSFQNESNPTQKYNKCKKTRCHWSDSSDNRINRIRKQQKTTLKNTTTETSASCIDYNNHYAERIMAFDFAIIEYIHK